MLDLVEAARKRTAPAVTNRLAAYQEWKLPKDHLSPYREALSGGDAARGRKLFYEHAAVACTRCHQIGSDSGGNAGPKLDGIAGRATAEHLLESVVFPNRQISQGFETTMITTRNGGLYAGVVKSEDATSLVIATPDEGDVKLAKFDVKTRERGVSGMPEGFGEILSRRELRDLVAYLSGLR
jgi:quinoprotein glucose dehydrogenase